VEVRFVRWPLLDLAIPRISTQGAGRLRRGCAVASVPLPSSGSRGPVKPVALEFSADLFRRESQGKKDLESISLNFIDQAHAIRKLLFSGFVVLSVLDYG
jgi:hypothetical protein